MVAFEFGREVMERLRQSNVASILEVMLTDIGKRTPPPRIHIPIITYLPLSKVSPIFT